MQTLLKPLPLQIPQQEPNPTAEQVDYYHEQYIAMLTKVYNDNKEQFAQRRKQSLAILPKASADRRKKK